MRTAYELKFETMQIYDNSSVDYMCFDWCIIPHATVCKHKLCCNTAGYTSDMSAGYYCRQNGVTVRRQVLSIVIRVTGNKG